jgi:hypothetical protein
VVLRIANLGLRGSRFLQNIDGGRTNCSCIARFSKPNKGHGMSEVISSMTGPELIGFVAVVGGLICITLIVVTAITVPLVTWARRNEANAQLKRDLAAAGFTAEDIERVVVAAPGEPVPAKSGCSGRRC